MTRSPISPVARTVTSSASHRIRDGKLTVCSAPTQRIHDEYGNDTGFRVCDHLELTPLNRDDPSVCEVYFDESDVLGGSEGDHP